MRLCRGGATLSAAEYRLLCLLVAALPAHLRDIVERQFDAYNLVQREADGRALNFYRVQPWSNKVLSVSPLLTSKANEAPLVRIGIDVAGDGEPLHAVLTAVDGRVFCVSFNRVIPKNLSPDSISVRSVTQAWRSNFAEESDAA